MMPKELTRGFLEEAWKLAKKQLPGWAYATLLVSARAAAGGKATKKPKDAEKPPEIDELFKWSEGEPLFVGPLFESGSVPTEQILKTEDLAQLRAAARRSCEIPESRGFGVAKGSDFQGFDFESRASFPVMVLSKREASNGKFNYFGGVRAHGLECSNVVKFRNEDFVNLGATFNTEINAKPGDVLKVSVLEMNADTKNDSLSWLGARVLKVEDEGVYPWTAEKAYEHERRTRRLQKALELVPTIGPKDAKIAFVGASPSSLELIRGEPFVGPARHVFEKNYLEPLGLSREEVVLTHVCPEHLDPLELVEENFDRLNEWRAWLEKDLEELNPRIVVALGRTARAVLGERADFVLPHPTAVHRFGDSGEVARKLRRIKKKLDSVKISDNNSLDADNTKGVNLDPNSQKGEIQDPAIDSSTLKISQKESEHLADTNREEQKSNDDKRSSEVKKREMLVPISKADSVKQIVYGIVLDPYGKDGAQEDAHHDWPSPAGVESSSHDFMLGPRTIGVQHSKKANAVLVESWIPQYPSPKDREKAMRGEAHKVYRQKFGDDVIHSGSWLVGVKLGDQEWKMYQKGDLNAFSPGGAAIRNPISREQMPKVEFIDLVPKEA